MNEEQFNMELRKFLKRFGISAQREIEDYVRAAQASGVLAGTTELRVRARLEIDGKETDLLIEESLPIDS